VLTTKVLIIYLVEVCEKLALPAFRDYSILWTVDLSDLFEKIAMSNPWETRLKITFHLYPDLIKGNANESRRSSDIVHTPKDLNIVYLLNAYREMREYRTSST
jgi:hypothetical protein